MSKDEPDYIDLMLAERNGGDAVDRMLMRRRTAGGMERAGRWTRRPIRLLRRRRTKHSSWFLIIGRAVERQDD
jgi:hypothetical protein